MKERAVLLHSEVRSGLAVAIAAAQAAGETDTTLHVLLCRIDTSLLDPAQVELNRDSSYGVFGSLVPVFYSETSTFKAPQLIQGIEYGILEWISDSGLDIEALIRGTISASAALPMGGGRSTLEVASIPIRETLAQGIVRSFAYSAFQGAIPTSLRKRWPLVHVAEAFFELVFVENNIKVYKDALAFGRPKAHKDVRTYREALRSLERGQNG